MNGKIKKGLGIGCAILFIAFMMLLGGTVYFARQMGKDYKVVKELETQLVEAHGLSTRLPDQFNGLPSSEQLESFLAVRERTSEWRLKVETSFHELMADEGLEEVEGFKHFLRVLKASRDLAPVFSGFWTARNQSLLDNGMGMGEYIYLYFLTYNSWLGLDPSDGARDAGAFLSGLGATGPMVKQGAERDDDLLDDVQRRQWAWQQVNRLMLPLMQQAARQSSVSSDPAVLIWAEELQQEIQAMQDDPLRIPFAGVLPEAAGQGFEPYRGRLEGTYSVTVNPIELIFEDTWENEEE